MGLRVCGACIRANFEAVYGKSARELAQEWERYILELPVMDRSTGDLASARFAALSLFEKPCPHYTPKHVRSHRSAMRALWAGDTTLAERHVSASLRRAPTYEPALGTWAALRLAQGDEAAVLERFAALSIETLAWVVGDAHTLLQDVGEARQAYERARDMLPGYARESAARLEARQALLAHPDAARTALGGQSPEERARALARYGAYGADFASAYLWAQSGRYEQAAEKLRTSGEAPSATLESQRLAWLARWTYYAGNPELAATYARRAARLYGEARALNAAAMQIDVALKMAWLARM